MRVLHVTQPTVAGVPVVVRGLARDQQEHGWDVAVASPADGDLPGWLADLGVPHLAWRASRDPGVTVPSEVLRLRRLVREVDPDVVHLHSAKAGLAGRLALRGARPTVFQPHAWSFEAAQGPVARLARLWERSGTQWTHLLVCVSEDERRRGEDVGIRARTVVLPNGIDLERYRSTGAAERVTARRALGLEDRPTVVCIGRLAQQKGQDVLLESLPAVRSRVPDVQVVLVGDGPDADALRSRAGEDVRFVGAQPDVRPWLTAADVVALPSRWEAGLSLVAMEAMALGRSVVSTDVAGARDGLAGAGAVVPREDAAALASALTTRLEDPGLAESEGRAGRVAVESAHDLAVTSRRVREAYETVLAGGLPGAGRGPRRP
ncbi:glycosyltransferase [Geodermatophilus aquaeductus]|uniref:Glycosyltransferase involved in cell wall bisynthesis n=1 Tax=Geodermatophilus aquaeductus TaxID=1564161 RepID=A0A521FQW7_9ACTN|nr:Glycosyltransferase involved in cell wall bisynthesis [Geodermatophilus aquaeductus]